MVEVRQVSPSSQTLETTLQDFRVTLSKLLKQIMKIAMIVFYPGTIDGLVDRDDEYSVQVVSKKNFPLHSGAI